MCSSDLCLRFSVCPPELVAYAESWTPSPIVVEHSLYRGVGTNTEQWRPLVATHWPAPLVDTAMCLMQYESGGNPDAKNPESSARGLFQIMASVWAPTFGVSYDDLYDPELNVRLAHRIYETQGWTAWSPYNRGLCR